MGSSREIEFRAWNNRHEKMYPVYMLNFESDLIYCRGDDYCGHTFGKIDCQIMQFTGLLDKNGVKIFEGDIVKWDDNSNGRYWRVAIVSIEPDLRFKCFDCPEIENSSAHGKTFKFGSFIYTDTHNHLYVIGNIHSNP